MAHDSTGIRPYGPGKFNTLLDAWLYEASLNDGPDEETGENETTGWYGLLRGPFEPEASDDLNAAERAELEKTVGVILCEIATGFVHVEYFTDSEIMDARWETVCREVDEDTEEQ